MLRADVRIYRQNIGNEYLLILLTACQGCFILKGLRNSMVM